MLSRMRWAGVLLIVIVAAVACGPSATPTPTPTATPTATRVATPTPTATPGATPSPSVTPSVTPTATPTATRPPATPTATPTPTQGPIPPTVPQPKNPPGTVIIAVANIPEGGSLNRAGRGQEEVFWGAAETLFTSAPGPKFSQPWLVKSWQVAPNLSKVTLELQQGVQFHKGFGEMTAEDVVWSINDANAAVTPESVHLQAGDLAGMFGEWRVLDRYTVEAPFTTFDPRWQNYAISDGFQPTAINSKRAYDQNGEEWMKTNVVATGPFQVSEWVRNDHVNMEAVQNHWRKTPAIRYLQWRAISDSTTRVAALRVGEVDIAAVELSDAPSLLDLGFRRGTNNQGSEINIPMAGNYWAKVHDITGEPVTRDGFDPSLPWVGDPDNPDDMEKARLVRWALAMAIDRELIAETVGVGLAWPSYVGMFNPIMPEWQDKWTVPYDPQKARDYLRQAGYPNGFDINIYARTDSPIHGETANAVAGFWREIGINVTVDSYPYQVWRPTLVNRTAKNPWISPCESGRLPRPWDWPVGTDMTTISRGGFGCGMEIPFLAQKFLEGSKEADPAKRGAINNEVADYLHNWMLLPGVMTVPSFFMYNPRSIASWEPRPSLLTTFTAPENIVPAR